MPDEGRWGPEPFPLVLLELAGPLPLLPLRLLTPLSLAASGVLLLGAATECKFRRPAAAED